MSARASRSSTALKLFVLSAFLGAGASLGSITYARAQEASSAIEFNTPYGFRMGEENQPIEGSTRDENGNRLIVDGRIMSSASFSRSSSLSEFHSAGVGSAFDSSATAIGNNLSIVTQGSFNTVIVDSTQINNGNQEAVLNGKLSLD
ncbi:MAG: holdfast anchoring protein HfaA [Alphaproteobacteria bacterium]|nr:holdfast anchoring protein HfaA [Alphaproteobacteria bacterium]